jgi:hypothetical protein
VGLRHLRWANQNSLILPERLMFMMQFTRLVAMGKKQ